MTWTKKPNERLTEMTTYRPRNVIRFLANEPDLPAYLARIGLPGFEFKEELRDAIGAERR